MRLDIWPHASGRRRQRFEVLDVWHRRGACAVLLADNAARGDTARFCVAWDSPDEAKTTEHRTEREARRAFALVVARLEAP